MSIRCRRCYSKVLVFILTTIARIGTSRAHSFRNASFVSSTPAVPAANLLSLEQFNKIMSTEVLHELDSSTEPNGTSDRSLRLW